MSRGMAKDRLRLPAGWLVGLAALASVSASAQSTGGGYVLVRSTPSAGGHSVSGVFALHGVIGEPAGVTASAGPYVLTGGFATSAGAAGATGDGLFSDGFE
jgi:hypothetical protein